MSITLLSLAFCPDRAVGYHAVEERAPHFYDGDYRIVKQSIRIILTRNSTEKLPATYERIYNACRSVVCLAKKGAGLYDDVLKLELERLLRDERNFRAPDLAAK